MLSFDAACAYLFPRLGESKTWSLQPTTVLLDSIGNPHQQMPAIHVGGTNGKGSVCHLISNVLRAAGWRVGLFTSPHLVDVRERFVTDGCPITRAAFASWTERLQPVIEQTGASFFEASTAIAFADFAAHNVDIAVVEVGLGGRLDSTNVVTPVVAGITNIGLEHEEYLGSSLRNIALEKVGIAKHGVPLVIGEQRSELIDVMTRQARDVGALVTIVPEAATYRGPLGLQGRHQRRNAAIAVEILSALPDRFGVDGDLIDVAFRETRVPGRFDRRGRWLFDVAHNPAGIASLIDNLTTWPPTRPLHVVFGALADKPGNTMLQLLVEIADNTWVTFPPSAPAHRTSTRDVWPTAPNVTIEEDFDRALSLAERSAGTVLVTGSFHTVGDAMARLPGFQPVG